MTDLIKINVKLADRGFCDDCRKKRRSSFPIDTKYKDNFFNHIAKHLDAIEGVSDVDLDSFLKTQTIVVGAGDVIVRLTFDSKDIAK